MPDYGVDIRRGPAAGRLIWSFEPNEGRSIYLNPKYIGKAFMFKRLAFAKTKSPGALSGALLKVGINQPPVGGGAVVVAGSDAGALASSSALLGSLGFSTISSGAYQSA
jgi:hypothetical protein